MEDLSAEFWSKKYENQQTGWDLGAVSPPLKAYFDQLTDKNLKILIPGCGRGYEGIYLFENGFSQVHLADFSPLALDEVKNNCPNFPSNNLHCTDFFALEGKFDLIIEQTLFCAIDPKLREKYVKKCADLLNARGKMVGLLFNREFESGPPFGGTQAEYMPLFEKYFSTVSMQPCYNSIAPRQDAELFFRVGK